MKNSRAWSFVAVTVGYVVATVIGWLIWRMLNPMMHPYWAMFVADAVATVFVWAIGLVFKNVSYYDPYWSVAPPVILTMWVASTGKVSVTVILALVAVWYWAIRLTYNWAYTFHGLEHEDWRYSKYREACHPVIFQLINFFGLNMMPTVVVYLAMLPSLDMPFLEGSANVFTWLGFAVSVGAATIQLIADTQAHRFRKEHRGEVCQQGLWKHGRHPNYFGEIMMWWGVWIMYVSVAGFRMNAWFVVGPICITLLFRFISVPLMEGRQLKNKPAYAEYRKSTRMFI